MTGLACQCRRAAPRCARAAAGSAAARRLPSQRALRLSHERTDPTVFRICRLAPRARAPRPARPCAQLSVWPAAPALGPFVPLRAEVGAPIEVGAVAGGLRRLIPITGGR